MGLQFQVLFNYYEIIMKLLEGNLETK